MAHHVLSADLSAYFLSLFEVARGLPVRLFVPVEPQPIRYVSDVLEPATEARREEETVRLRAIDRPCHRTSQGGAVGLNTIGILADRLSILAIKCWNLENRHKDANAAQRVLNEDVADVIAAMVVSRPGRSTMLTKVSRLSVSVHDGDWAECFYGLCAANLLMWEAQETMYLTGLEEAEPEELRALMRWASRGNLQRNHYIRRAEDLYWNSA